MKIRRQFSPYIYVCILLLTVVRFSAAAQTYNAGSAYVSGNVYIKSSFTNAASATYQNDGALYITGNFNNNQPAMAEGTGATQFIGSIQQSLNGNQSPVFHDVLINNSNGLQMNLNAAMGGVISPVAGSLYFNGFALTMGGQVNTAYTNPNAFNVTATSDLNITGNAAAGNGLYFDPSANTIHNVTVLTGATGTLGNALNITPGTAFGTVVVNGNFNAAGLLTLKSDSAGTAIVGPSGGIIINNVTVERFIPAFRAWRFLAVPFTSSGQTINQAWQEGAVNTCLTCNVNPVPGYGTQITYNGNTLLGFDPNITQNASLVLWDVPTQKWTTYAPSTTNTNIRAYPAYEVYVRGSRDNHLQNGVYAIPDNTTLRIKGVLNEIGSSVSTGALNGADGQYVLIGNPFASPVNVIDAFNTSGSSGIDKTTFTVMDPKFNNDGRNVGAYVVYKTGINNWVPFGISYPSGYPPVVQSGQGLMVKLQGMGTHQVSFAQANKFLGQQISVFGFQKQKTESEQQAAVIYTNLMSKAVSKDSLCIADGIAAGFREDFSDEVNDEDVRKLWNVGENIALVRDAVPLSIEMRQLPVLTDTLFYRLYLRQQPYTLKIIPQHMLMFKAWLVDKYLNTKTEVRLTDTTLYSFTPNTDTNSYRNRFMLVFKRQLATTPVPVSKAKNQKDPNDSGIAAKINSNTIFFSAYPNPAKAGSIISIETSVTTGTDAELQLFDIKGKKISSRKIDKQILTAKRLSFSLPAGIAAGMYSLRLVKNNGQVLATDKLILTGK